MTTADLIATLDGDLDHYTKTGFYRVCAHDGEHQVGLVSTPPSGQEPARTYNVVIGVLAVGDRWELSDCTACFT